MTNSITDKTWVMVLIGGDRHFLTESEAQKVKQSLSAGSKFIDLGSVFFATGQFAKLMNHADYEMAQRIKRGDYKCRNCDSWIPYGKQCGQCKN